MAVSVKHRFVSPVADAGNPEELGPNEWNDTHDVTGLENVDNTSDASKPVSTATQAALDLKLNITSAREVLTAPRTYYVRTDGSDSNTGLAGTVVGAFLTVQKAIDAAAALDSSIYDVTIQVAGGTYATAVGLVAKTMVGAGAIIIVGDETTPANVVLTSNGTMGGNDGLLASLGTRTVYHLRGVQLSSSASGSVFGLYTRYGSVIKFQNIDFGSGITQHIRAADFGIIEATGNYSISAGGASSTHYVTANGAIRVQLSTITIVGTPAFNTFAMISSLGMAFLNGNTYSGSVTGVRYQALQNSIIQVNGAGGTYLPGDSAGTTATGGQYV